MSLAVAFEYKSHQLDNTSRIALKVVMILPVVTILVGH